MTGATATRPVLGADIGGTKLAAGVVATDGSVLSWRTIPTDLRLGPDGVLDCLADLCRAAVADAGLTIDGLAALGIGCGGPLDPDTGIVHSPPNLPGWDETPVRDRLASALGGLPAVIENDATAAALAEWRYGAGRGTTDMAYITISTGIGGGVIAGGRLLRGAGGNAAEVGHLSIRFDGWPCVCGRRGCPEAFASGTNIARRASEALANGESSSLREPVTAKSVAEAAAAGDPLAGRVWDETTEVLGELVASVLDAFDPEVVVLGGGVTNAGEQLLGPVREQALRLALAPSARAARIERAALGDRLGVVAAAGVAIERLGAGQASGEHLEVAARVHGELLGAVDRMADEICATLAGGGTIYTFGNGGSAADAQHLAAELVGRYRASRRALPAIAFTVDPSVVSAIANDFDWDDVFARQVEAHARPGDLVLAFTTSGTSTNVTRGLERAKALGARTAVLTGAGGGDAARIADLTIVVPSDRTARIQEMHVLFIHLLSDQVDTWAEATA
ncbi:MAG: ROK family protein [Chloroflexota bacterium]